MKLYIHQPFLIFKMIDWVNLLTLSICIYLQPARNTHPGFIRDQYFMFEFAAFKKNCFAIFGSYVLKMIAVLDTQFPAIG